jgi:hypothetical protein
MKKILMIAILGLLLVSCGESDDSGNDDEGGIQELTLRQTATGTISQAGEVDWYHYRVVEANAVLQVKCSSNTYRPDVTLLTTIYTDDAAGNRVRLYADHAPEDSQLPADIEMNVYMDVPKDIYISVRDLMDDDSSDHPYYLSIDFAQGGDENGDFSQATRIDVDGTEPYETDTIGYIGDVDCFRFTADLSGIYDVHLAFSPFAGGTEVELCMDLYNDQGALIMALNRTQRLDYHIISYLEAGDYYILIDDYGKNDFDTASSYTVKVTTLDSQETMANDTRSDAAVMAYDDATRTFSANGSLDYLEDQDWYSLPLSDVDTTGFKILQIQFDDLNPEVQFNYQINVEDQDQVTRLAHTFSGGSSVYVSQIRAGAGDHFLHVQPSAHQDMIQKAPYEISVQVLDIDDPAETALHTDPDTGELVTGNDTIDTAMMLTPTSASASATTGKIGFRGDVDWYYVAIPDPTTPRILELYLDTGTESSLVEYSVSFIRDGVIKKMVDTNGQDGGTNLKGSIYIPAFQASDQLSYYFKVSDYQGDDGDGQVPYNIRANLLDIPDDLPPDAGIPANARTYVSEITEGENSLSETIFVEVDSLTQKTFLADTTLLAFNNNSPAQGVSITENPDQTRTIVFPWIAGYIDFQGDQDWYAVDLGPWMEAGVAQDTSWYYDIQIELHVDSPGGDVEYVWKFFRDVNGNQILVDRPQDSDGFFASAGDGDLAPQAIDITTPQGDDPFWVGDEWEGRFYLNMSDFNYVGAELPDDDWGYESKPYYVRMTLTYHPGQSHP